MAIKIDDIVTLTLGHFRVDGDLRVTDPCYDKGCEFAAHVLPAAPGIWEATVDVHQGERAYALTVYHKELCNPDLPDWEDPDWAVSVDSGQVGVFLNSRYPDDVNDEFMDSFSKGRNLYNDCCSVTLTTGWGTVPDGMGVVSNTAYGDGGYPVRVVRKDGKIVGVAISFMDDEDIEE